MVNKLDIFIKYTISSTTYSLLDYSYIMVVYIRYIFEYLLYLDNDNTSPRYCRIPTDRYPINNVPIVEQNIKDFLWFRIYFLHDVHIHSYYKFNVLIEYKIGLSYISNGNSSSIFYPFTNNSNRTSSKYSNILTAKNSKYEENNDSINKVLINDSNKLSYNKKDVNIILKNCLSSVLVCGKCSQLMTPAEDKTKIRSNCKNLIIDYINSIIFELLLDIDIGLIDNNISNKNKRICARSDILVKPNFWFLSYTRDSTISAFGDADFGGDEETQVDQELISSCKRTYNKVYLKNIVSKDNLADGFTKYLNTNAMKKFKESIL
ncbi:hypothetical protein H8356DRAFT_1321262 [Neocallimastix lanati (nom. inval.)]|nr:hypothetical protein H8356DRAFT_1321262 [Neocallimastix sp. JGI-2020a]